MNQPERDFLLQFHPLLRADLLVLLSAKRALEEAREALREASPWFGKPNFWNEREQLKRSVFAVRFSIGATAMLADRVDVKDENARIEWPKEFEETVEGPSVVHRALRTFEKFTPIVANNCDMELWNSVVLKLRAEVEKRDAK